MGTGLLIWSYLLPMKVFSHDQIPNSYYSELIEAGLLEKTDKMKFFYSAAYFSILADGNIFTDCCIVSYEIVEQSYDDITEGAEDEYYLNRVAYEDVEGYEVEDHEDTMGDPVVYISIYPKTGESFSLFFLNDEDQKSELLSFLKERLGGLDPIQSN